MTETIKVLIDHIDPIEGIKNNILPAIRRIDLTLESRFPDLNIEYYPSYFVDKVKGKWIYPIIISNLNYMHWLFQYQPATVFEDNEYDKDSSSDIFSLIPNKVAKAYKQGNGIIMIFIFEPLPLNSSIENFKNILESSSIYKNIRILSLHYVNCVNFIPSCTAIWTDQLDNFSVKGRKYKPNYLGKENNRYFSCFLMNYKESDERKKLLLFLEKSKFLSKGFVTAEHKAKNLSYNQIKFKSSNLIFEDLDIEDTLNKVELNIIPEGEFNSPGEPYLAEKIYRCFKYKKPFIFIGRAGTLKYLRKLGYKTFSPVINEEYDTIENSNKRLKYIFTEINRLVSDNIDIQELKNICEHNYDLYYKIINDSNKRLYRDIVND